MISYMDLIQQCFYSSTDWGYDNSYEHILATPRNLLDFPIPNGVKVIVSNRNTKYNYSSINISQVDNLEGSLSYLSSSTNLDDYYKPSKLLPVSSIIQGYRDLMLLEKENKTNTNSVNNTTNKPYLLYGKMYFPSQYLEGMLIKRFTPYHQLIVKFVNTPKLNKLTQPTTIFTLYLQRQTENSAHDFIYSTCEDLFGFRCIYHFNLLNNDEDNHNLGLLNKTEFITSKLRSNVINHPSKFSTGCEIWYASKTISPGLSIAARYTTYIDSIRYLSNNSTNYRNSKGGFINPDINPYVFSNPAHNPRKIMHSIPYAISTIHPLTFTLATNPLLGYIESTYAIGTDVSIHGDNYHGNKNVSYAGKLGVVLSTKYQFNIYSYDSDLTLGVQLLRSKLSLYNKVPEIKVDDKITINSDKELHHEKHSSTHYQPYNPNMINKLPQISQHNIVYKIPENSHAEKNTTIASENMEYEDKKPKMPKRDEIKEFQELKSDNEYISSLKISGSLIKNTVRLAWEGKFHNWFISSGASVDMKSVGTSSSVLKYGIEFAYNS